MNKFSFDMKNEAFKDIISNLTERNKNRLGIVDDVVIHF